jgi:hypothetical protein
MRYINRFLDWLCSLREPKEIIPVWENEIKAIPVLGTEYILTMRDLSEIIKLANNIKGSYIHIGGGVYHIDTISSLIRKQNIKVTIHETGSCLLFSNNHIPELENGFASTFLFKETIKD